MKVLPRVYGLLPAAHGFRHRAVIRLTRTPGRTAALHDYIEGTAHADEQHREALRETGAAGQDTARRRVLVVVALEKVTVVLGDTGCPGAGILPRFTQTAASPYFRHGPFAGQSISDVAADLGAGNISPSALPVDVISRGDNVLGLNTRSMLALRRAGISPSDWTMVGRTGQDAFEQLVDERLARNGLTNAGTEVLRITGAGPWAQLAEMSRNTMPNDYEEAWVLPFKSQEFMQGPQLHQRFAEVELRLDHETETGEYIWSAIMFRGVHALRFTAHPSCSRDQVRAYDRLVQVNRSAWLERLKGAEPSVRHYRIYFDEFGCYDIAAVGFEVREEG